MVTETMSSVQLRKRRWKSSPQKSARSSLDFSDGSPSPKKRRRETTIPVKLIDVDSEADTFTIKSFYGKKEKTHFPHSPQRRKRVGKVLAKISDENTDSDADAHHGKKVTRSKTVSKGSSFEFHSTDSGDTENEETSVNILKTQNKNQKPTRKVPLKITINKTHKTPKSNGGSNSKLETSSAGKVLDRRSVKGLETPTSSGKKFFKTRSPASADKGFGSIVIQKGFNLKFVPRRLNVDKSKITSLKNTKPKNKTISNLKQHKLPKKPAHATATRIDDCEGVFFIPDNDTDGVDGESHQEFTVLVKDDGTEVEVADKQSSDQDVDHSLLNGEDNVQNDDCQNSDSPLQQSEQDCYECMATKLYCVKDGTSTDSAIETAHSNDLFSDDASHTNVSVDPEISSVSELVNTEADECNNAGSEDLFSVSGRASPMPASERNSPDSSIDTVSILSEMSEQQQQSDDSKLFPIFRKTSPNTSPLHSPGRLRKLRSLGSPSQSPLLQYKKSFDKNEQMIIDAGQKKFGVTQCGVCGMVYTQADPADETMHLKFHRSLLNTLKFPGWKNERVVYVYPDSGSRVILVTTDDPKYAVKKVEEINKVMGQELGFPEPTLAFRPSYKAFLFVSYEGQIEGCCVTEPITEGYPVITDETATQCQTPAGQRPWCCSDTPVKATVGISRIWVYNQARRRGVATKLLDCVRHRSCFGAVVPKNKLAFSDPTPDGKILATKYTGTPSFLVYKFH